MSNIDKISAEKSVRSGRCKYRWEDNTKMYRKETGLENLDLFNLAYVSAVWWAAGNTRKELRVF